MRSKYKIVFLGDAAVGKTTLLSQYAYKQAEKNYHPTIGIDFLTQQLKINNEIVKLQLWDTAGQERFNSIIPNYTRDCFMAVIVYDLTDIKSYIHISHWVENLVRIYDENNRVKILIVGNKKDLMLREFEKKIFKKSSSSNEENTENKADQVNKNYETEREQNEIQVEKGAKEKTKNHPEALLEINGAKIEQIGAEVAISSQQGACKNFQNTSTERTRLLNEMIQEKISEGIQAAKKHNGKFIMTCAMNYCDIQDLIHVIFKEIEEDIKSTGNCIDLGKERVHVDIEAKPKKRCC
ncbi:small GTP-binding protein domain [Edhazardia aedis USNM 41457]|uniref:Small GTP-binding protein domain n=1 Tax=Edhazardia aedis (strain USNM 41457) TaxID=1003232 RepID=J9DV05_EDHAE|nr:small GTP-binding protein domain [Edhazardia aedis USNM 41457]|eukprot:EJW05102.1 small GTP-binding protein domain [Edhazardia aedis USNM 41457]